MVLAHDSYLWHLLQQSLQYLMYILQTVPWIHWAKHSAKIKEPGYYRTSTKAFKPSGQCVLLHHFEITHVNTMPFSKKLSRPWRISLTTTKTNVGIHISHEWSSKTYRDDAVSVIIWRLLLMEIFSATKLCALLCLTHWTRPCSKTYMEYNLSSIEDNLQKRTVFAST